MIPRRFAPVLFSFILSGVMSLLVSGLSTFAATGATANFAALWLRSWGGAWLLAFPLVMVISPAARRIVESLTSDA